MRRQRHAGGNIGHTRGIVCRRQVPHLRARRQKVVCEVVGFNNDKVLAMPFMNLDGVGPGNQVDVSNAMPVLFPDISWLGRVINAMGEPVDGKGPLIKGKVPCLIHNSPPPAHSRERVAGKADLGVRAINTFLTVCKGQRMGILPDPASANRL